MNEKTKIMTEYLLLKNLNFRISQKCMTLKLSEFLEAKVHFINRGPGNAGGTCSIIFNFIVLMRDEMGNFKNLKIGLHPKPSSIKT